jgi:hypothetical protein
MKKSLQLEGQEVSSQKIGLKITEPLYKFIQIILSKLYKMKSMHKYSCCSHFHKNHKKIPHFRPKIKVIQPGLPDMVEKIKIWSMAKINFLFVGEKRTTN